MNDFDPLSENSMTSIQEQKLNPELMQDLLIALTNIQLQNQQRAQPVRDPKIPDVEIYDGSKANYSNFLAKINNFFLAQPNTYDTGHKKVSYVISRLSGIAADWSTTVIENRMAPQNAEILSNWHAFQEAFKKFSDPFLKQNATAKLLACKQGHTQSVLAYWTKFSEYLYKSEIQPSSARPLFESGLKVDLRLRMADKEYPEDLDSFVSAVIALDNRLYRIRSETSRNRMESSTGFVERQSQNGLAPMQIGNFQTLEDNPARWKEIRMMEKEASRQVCFSENRCFYCKRVVGNPPSHTAKDCPLKVNTTARTYLCKAFPDLIDLKSTLHQPKDQAAPARNFEDTSELPTTRSEVKEISFVKGLRMYSLLGRIEQHTVPAILIDSGAIGFAFMDENYARSIEMTLKRLKSPLRVNAADDSDLGDGIINYSTKAVKLFIGNHLEEIEFLIISCPRNPVILGSEWLEYHNPMINWRKRTIEFTSCDHLSLTPKIFGDSLVSTLEENDVILFAGLYTCKSNLSEELYESPPHSDDIFVKNLISNYKHVFSFQEFPDLPPHRDGIDLNIKLLPGKIPFFGPIYSLSRDEEKALREYLEGALKAGIIRPSTSPAGSPVMFVKKPDGSLRLCVDYRGLNSVTYTNKTALPIIKDMLSRTHGSKFFSKVDLKSAFNLIRIAPGDEYLTAFRTKYGHYEYLVMPFGLKNAPGVFQAFLNHVFGDLIDCGVLGYVDDLLIHAQTRMEHDRLLLEVFSRLEKFGLKANPKKCEFLKSKIKFLGH